MLGLPLLALALDLPDARYKTLPCRPTIACTADLVTPGAFELETGYLSRRIDTSARSCCARQLTFPFLAKLTLARWVQLQVGSNGYTVTRVARGGIPAQFQDDITLGLKLHLLDQSEYAPAVALSGTASIPTVAGEGYLRTYDALFTAYVTKDVGPLHADLNGGLNVWRLDGIPLPQGFAALALSTTLGCFWPEGSWGLMAEGYVFSDASPVASRDGGVLFAVNHAPREWLMFDVGGDIGFFPSTRAYSVFVGMTVVPVVLWR
jgi:hypothetical protein